MKKNVIISILAVLGIGAAFYFILQNNKKKNNEQVAIVAEKNTNIAVRTATVAAEDVSGEFLVNGTFLPNRQAQISAEMGGQLIALYVKEGSYVSAGQSIGRLSGDKVNVNVSSAKANLDNAQMALNRYEQAYKTGGVTALQLDQARLQVTNAKAQLQSANLTSGDTNIISKVSGIVNQKFVEVGTVLGAGTPIVEVVDISSVKLKVDVDQSLVSELAVGNIVKVQPDVIEGTVDGRITFIAPSSSGALKFPVEITVQNSGRQLKAGMYGTAVFNRSGSSNVLTVPREAFVGSVSDNQIFVVRGDRAHLTKVQSGVNFGEKVEIISGLKAGDQVVTSGQINLTDKSKVKVLK
ncbi:efflux RND transporter periplasmic adaptor subunit [Chryseobacterium sp. MFBS3-17]|uniref:efflux RND transporter periplasmic adaptor subunit n=1 Tax=Chryseobacterium sp. MFBS3-17 TaxID=2886689 RepID=UPI001D0DC41F|nr:efflux RND transporter periplasmic adaptor subunit [Chryseobacterium sp. MFBS3-17]MCC2591478.1 efflux RND transporter periplasmic adaptor subunit [Chryseobacterium sp. MFBS3-17]